MKRLEWSSPFPIKQSPRDAVFYIHGFLETPMSFTYLANRLSESTNLSQHGMVLPGHGSTPDRLKNTTKKEWYRSARREFSEVKQEYDRVIICGFSLGGLLAYSLANEFNPTGLILLAPAFRYRYSVMKWYPETIGRVMSYLPQFGVDGLNDREFEHYFACYYWIPMDAVRELTKFQQTVNEQFDPERLDCPTRLLQSINDRVIDSDRNVDLAKDFRHPASGHRLFKRSGHVLALDRDRDQVANEMMSFVEKLSRG